MRLYFITNSIKNSKNANTIQTLNMLKSFNDLDVKVHSFWFVKRIYPSITEDQILIPKIKFGSVVYAFICIN